ncbi:unnamed protein product [Phytophthora fragariaefolia]|uniref:Unnamed protein product n=1 Tax=Phytophthora fragariaefolia TaxID=1490495 RepID=A0A9W6WKC4_9STRA|nr:unnamed protein product [Phytophthora fragariaefolia]
MLLLLLPLLAAVADAACSRDTTALTSDCSSQCYEGRPCVAFAADATCNASLASFGTCVSDANSSSSSSGGDSCAFECFTNGPNDFAANGAVQFSDYVFFIPYGSEQSKWEANWTSSQASTVDDQLATEVDETQFYPSESNLVLENLEPLTFLDETTTAYEALGRWFFFVTMVERVDGLLFVLCFVRLVQDVCGGHEFVGREGDLSGNTLTEVPSNIFDMPNLKSLNLSDNSFTGVSLTANQVTFLQGLDTLTIDTFGGVSSCSESAQVKISGVAVCTSTGNGASSSSSGGSSSSNTGAIVGGIVGALVVAVLLGAAFFCYRRRKASGKGFGTATGFSDPSARGGLSLWNDQELLSLQINPDDIEDIRKLGTGAFGVVYLAKYRQNKLVACKRLKKGEATYENTQSFIAEIKLCATLDHPRVVQLLGVAWTIESDLQAIFEYMSNGDLRTYLEKSKSAPKTWNAEKLQLAADITEALVYVHSFSPPIVHRDLKSRNVLLSEDMRAHLSDFGVARVRSANNTMTSGVGTGRWLAPEVIAGNRDYDQTSDIFALGVVLSELDTHMLPYEDARGAGGNPLADVAILQLVASGRLLPTFGPQCPPELQDLARRCMAFNPQARPTAVEVAFALRTLQKSGAFY